MARDFGWYDDNLWAVIKADGTFAGAPCVSLEEATELANQHEGSHVYNLCIEYDDDVERYPENYGDDFYEPEDILRMCFEKGDKNERYTEF